MTRKSDEELLDDFGRVMADATVKCGDCGREDIKTGLVQHKDGRCLPCHVRWLEAQVKRLPAELVIQAIEAAEQAGPTRAVEIYCRGCGIIANEVDADGRCDYCAKHIKAVCALCGGPAEDGMWHDPDGNAYHRLCVPYAGPNSNSHAVILWVHRSLMGKEWHYSVTCGLCKEWSKGGEDLVMLARQGAEHITSRHRSRR